MEETLSGTSAHPTPPTRTAPRVPHQRAEPLLEQAVRYAEERHWDVLAGAWLETVGGVPRCCCGEPACAAPGAHPLGTHWAREATGSAGTLRRLWARRPGASVLLPTGRVFDTVDVPDTAGCLALARLERMGLSLGPVTCSPDGRMHFFVLPGGATLVADLVRKLGWTPGALDLTVHGQGGWVAAPPTRLGMKGCVQWARRPTPANRWLPDAEQLLPALAYACGREAAAAREG